MAESQLRPDLTRSQLFPFVADRPRARFGAWYEMVPRSQGKTPGQHGTFTDCIARLPDIAAMGFDVRLFHADPPDRQDQSQGPQQCGDREPKAIPAAPTRSARPKAATTRCIRNSARWRISAPSSRPATSTAWKSRSTSPCNARPIIPGSSSIRNGSSAGRTARCAMRKIRRRNTRTSSIPISPREDAGALWNALRDVDAVLDRPGREDFPGRQSPHQAASGSGSG